VRQKDYIPMADMIQVNSSAVSAVGYENGTLYLQWKTGKLSTHPNVPVAVWNQLLAAPSIGQFIATHIRNKYKATTE